MMNAKILHVLGHLRQDGQDALADMLSEGVEEVEDVLLGSRRGTRRRKELEEFQQLFCNNSFLHGLWEEGASLLTMLVALDKELTLVREMAMRNRPAAIVYAVAQDTPEASVPPVWIQALVDADKQQTNIS